MSDAKTKAAKGAKSSKGTKAAANEDAQTELAEFETSLDELELLVSQMESGDLSLEESLQAFERGVALTRSCQQALKTAELRVQALTESDDDTRPDKSESQATE